MPPKPQAPTKLLNAAIEAVRENGFAATSVDDLCRRAGVTKGAFFHHFKTKEALGIAAARHWSTTTDALFTTAPYHLPADPLDRVLAYLEFRKSIIAGELAQFTCYLGTMVQETHGTPSLREACQVGIAHHAETLEADIEAAIALYHPTHPIEASGLALHFQTVIQGAFVMAKAWNDPETARASLDHLIAYVTLLFPRS